MTYKKLCHKLLTISSHINLMATLYCFTALQCISVTFNYVTSVWADGPQIDQFTSDTVMCRIWIVTRIWRIALKSLFANLYVHMFAVISWIIAFLNMQMQISDSREVCFGLTLMASIIGEKSIINGQSMRSIEAISDSQAYTGNC